MGEPMQRDVDVGLVRAFLTVAETGSVTGTARRLNRSQGAISQQIKRLEQLSGKALFSRAGQRMALTPEGKNLLGAATHFIAANDQIWAALSLPAIQGEVRFGAPYDIIGSYAPAILRRFSRAFPAIRVTLVCEDSALLLAELRAGRIDLALTTELGCGAGGETLRRDQLVWVGARGGSAHTRNPLPVSLGAESCVFRPVAIAALRKARRAWQIACEVSNMEPVRATLEADLAIAPMLRHSIPESLAALSERARLPRLPVFRVNLYEAARPNPAAKTFAENARLCMAVH
jgi:DNA-binding transcriptional LysR family regulator